MRTREWWSDGSGGGLKGGASRPWTTQIVRLGFSGVILSEPRGSGGGGPAEGGPADGGSSGGQSGGGVRGRGVLGSGGPKEGGQGEGGEGNRSDLNRSGPNRSDLFRPVWPKAVLA